MSVLNQSGDELVECPLCMEPLEVDDLNFYPCTCGYQICRFCWHRIRTDENGLCPACRKAYSENPADFKPLSKEEICRLKAEKRLKDQQRKQRVTENRKHLANVRVVQKNLVFVVGLPMRLADADVLKKHEYFGKFGKIHKVVINQSTSYAGSQGPSASAYVTYQRSEDALRAIEAVNNIVVDGRTVKTSLGTTKYCSHFMRNQSCPKPDCMYLHDLGDQEASFTKEEMHQGKHQEYERKLVQSLHINTTQRKPTPSPPVTGNGTRENGPNSQAKEAWPSLQPGQTKDTQSNCKESSPPTTQPNNQATNEVEKVTNNTTAPAAIKQQQQQNNNNKGEGSRRGKSNSESKAQAARNKHKNSQNKEKHGSTTTMTTATTTTTTTARTTSRSESNGNIKEDADKSSNAAATATRLKGDKAAMKLAQQVQDISINGLQNGLGDSQSHSEGSESEITQQREGSTPASTISSSEESTSMSSSSHPSERLLAPESSEDTAILGTSPSSTNSSLSQHLQQSQQPPPQSQQPPPGLHSTSNSSSSNGPATSTTQQPPPAPPTINHRSIFGQSDNNSFFSSNTFQKIPTSSTISSPPSTQPASTGVDWTNTGITPLSDSLPTVHSSEDWQAAFGFHQTNNGSSNNLQSPNSSPSPTSRLSFSNEDFLDIDVDTPAFGKNVAPNASNSIANSILNSHKFMADFQQQSLQRLAMQSTQNADSSNEYLKQNGHATLGELQKQQEHQQQGNAETLKADDDLGFDPFHETQKALAELMENEVQIQQQRLFQYQQHQQQREREEQTRVQQQQQQNSVGFGPHHLTQSHLAHLQQQAQHLQNLQVLQQQQQQQQQQPHSLLSRLPQTLLQQNGGAQSPVNVAGLGQRSRGLPPPGFPSSTPNHMNSFGLGIPRPAPNAANTLTDLLTGSKILPFVTHSSGVLFTGGQQQTSQQTSFLQNQNPLLSSQGVGKCASDAIYALKDWCDMSSQQQQQQQQQQQFHHQALYQKGGWNNFGSISDLNPVDPAIVSSRLLPFQSTTSTWQFPHAHPTHSQQEQSAPPAQHWAMQPPPGFAAPTPSVPLNVQQSSTAVPTHTKFIAAGSEIENI